MKHEELERKVAEIISEKPWKHEQAENCGLNFHCRKCKKIMPWSAWRKDPCPHPTPYTIPLVRKGNEQAYDACMGRAIECFRGLIKERRRDDLYLATPRYLYGGEEWESFASRMYKFIEWVLYDATPAEIWEICVNAIKDAE